MPPISQLLAGPAASGLAALLLLAPTSIGCASTLSGQVVDAQTGQPIAGAVVLGVWVYAGGAPGLAHSELVGVREAETDAEGRFALESLAGLPVEERITVYKSGYVAWSNLFSFPPLRRREKTAAPTQIRLEPFPPGESHWEHMLFIDLARSSGLYGNESNPKLQTAIDRERRMR